GTVDTTFSVGSGIDALGAVRSIVILNNNKILVGGRFTAYNGTAKKNVLCLNADGTLDPTFNTGGSGIEDYEVSTIISLADGKILLSGAFTAYNGVTANSILRLNADGTRDASFNSGTGVGGDRIIYSAAVQADEKIVIVGYFDAYNGTPSRNIARLNSDGTIDATFHTGSGADDYINSTAIQNDGKILVAGYLTSYKGIGRNRIARILSSGVTGTEQLKPEPKNVVVFPNPFDSHTTLQLDSEVKNGTIKLINVLGKEYK